MSWLFIFAFVDYQIENLILNSDLIEPSNPLDFKQLTIDTEFKLSRYQYRPVSAIEEAATLKSIFIEICNLQAEKHTQALDITLIERAIFRAVFNKLYDKNGQTDPPALGSVYPTHLSLISECLKKLGCLEQIDRSVIITQKGQELYYQHLLQI